MQCNTISELKDKHNKLTQDPVSKANILNEQFYSVFSDNKSACQGQLNPNTKSPTMPEIVVNNTGVLNLLKNLKSEKPLVQTPYPTNY